jgi:hypothetical protein
MNTPLTPWINLTLHQAQRYHRLAWFLYGWMEREQLLNLDAFVAWWVGGAASAPGRSRSCRRDGLAPVLAANATRASAHSTRPIRDTHIASVAQHMLDAHCDQAVVITDGGMVTGQVHPSQWNALNRPFANAG